MSRTGADGTSRNYVLNYATGLPSVSTIQSGGSDLRYYVYTPGGSLLYSIDAASNTHRYYSFDDTGSTTFLTDDTGAITDSYGISAYGDIVTAGAKNSTDNPFTWQGQFGVMQEPGTKLYYARFRYYDSATARFLTRDPLFSPAPKEVNPYQYAAGNPVANGDPTGLKTAMDMDTRVREEMEHRIVQEREMNEQLKWQHDREHPAPPPDPLLSHFPIVFPPGPFVVDLPYIDPFPVDPPNPFLVHLAFIDPFPSGGQDYTFVYYSPFNSTMVSQPVATVESQPVDRTSFNWPSMQSLTEGSYDEGKEAEEFWTNLAAAIASRAPIKNP